ncbi:MAG: hypothetical protein J0H29_04005 [Sphingobacteriales bacterium]|nr:hypothetical protein [Sphingobacteriales bacterium]
MNNKPEASGPGDDHYFIAKTRQRNVGGFLFSQQAIRPFMAGNSQAV